MITITLYRGDQWRQLTLLRSLPLHFVLSQLLDFVVPAAADGFSTSKVQVT